MFGRIYRRFGPTRYETRFHVRESLLAAERVIDATGSDSLVRPAIEALNVPLLPKADQEPVDKACELLVDHSGLSAYASASEVEKSQARRAQIRAAVRTAVEYLEKRLK